MIGPGMNQLDARVVDDVTFTASAARLIDGVVVSQAGVPAPGTVTYHDFTSGPEGVASFTVAP